MFSVDESGVSLQAEHTSVQSSGDVFTTKAAEKIPAVVTGPPVVFKLHAERLLPFLKRVSGKIDMQLLSHDKPVDIHAHGGTQETPVYRFLAMPMHLVPAQKEVAAAA